MNKNCPKWFQLLILFFSGIVLFSCSNEPAVTENKNIHTDTLTSDFVFTSKTDSIIGDGEYVKYYKSGVVEIRGTMKDGKREGLWKSWYEDGSPWSETNFANGKKNGRTISWYDNEVKRYEGFYIDDKESSTWTFWDEQGNIQSVKEYK